MGMPYEFYKVFHVASIFVFLSSASVLLLAKPAGKSWKIITGISSLFILVAGFGMLAKGHLGMPLWVQIKIVIWLVVTGLGHLVAKRFPSKALATYWITMILAFAAAYLAVYKPV